MWLEIGGRREGERAMAMGGGTIAFGRGERNGASRRGRAGPRAGGIWGEQKRTKNRKEKKEARGGAEECPEKE